MLAAEEPPPVREAAHEALKSITGMNSFGPSVLTWQDWWHQHRGDGREGLLDVRLARLQEEVADLRRSIRSLEEDRGSLVQFLIRWIEQAYALTEADRRPALVVSLLEDERREIRMLGLRLIERAMANAEPVDPTVVEAMARHIDDTESAVRKEVVRLLSLVDSQLAATLCVSRFRAESSPEVRLAMLTALTRAPSRDACPLLIESFQAMGDTFSPRDPEPLALTKAVLACAHARLLTPDEQVSAINAVFGFFKSEVSHGELARELSPEHVELLAWSSTERAVSLLRAILMSNSEAPLFPIDDPTLAKHLSNLRVSAARGLEASGFNDELLFSAAADPIVHPIAFRTLMARRGALGALQSLADSFATLNDETWRQGVEQCMESMPETDWIAADDVLAQEIRISIDDRIHWLSRALQTANHNGSGANGNGSNDGPADVTTQDPIAIARRSACFRLAELHVEQLNLEQALRALRAAPVAEESAVAFDELRTVLLIATGQLENRPAENTPDVSLWFRAFDLLDQQLALLQSRAEPHPEDLADRLRVIAARIESLAGESLTDSDRDRLAAVLSRIPVNQSGENSPPPSTGSDG